MRFEWRLLSLGELYVRPIKYWSQESDPFTESVVKIQKITFTEQRFFKMLLKLNFTVLHVRTILSLRFQHILIHTHNKKKKTKFKNQKQQYFVVFVAVFIFIYYCYCLISFFLLFLSFLFCYYQWTRYIDN